MEKKVTIKPKNLAKAALMSPIFREKKHGKSSKAYDRRKEKKVDLREKILERIDEMKSDNKGYGYHGEAALDSRNKNPDLNNDIHYKYADKEYSKAHKKIMQTTGTDAKTAKHFLDSTFGRHLYGHIDNPSHVKKEFKTFMKNYDPEQYKTR